MLKRNKEERCNEWIYWGKLYNTRFQAGCVAKRMEEDGWIYGFDEPTRIEIIQTRKGRFGIRYFF